MDDHWPTSPVVSTLSRRHPPRICVGGVLQVQLGLVVVSDMRVVAGIQCEGGIEPHVAQRVHRLDGPRPESRLHRVFQVSVGLVVVADVRESVGIQSERGPRAHVARGIHRLRDPDADRRFRGVLEILVDDVVIADVREAAGVEREGRVPPRRRTSSATISSRRTCSASPSTPRRTGTRPS
jgi:hypothetical protein